MAVVLDTVAHPPGDRADLVREVIARSGARRRVELRAPAEAVDVRAEAWEVGATHVLRAVGTPLTLPRTTQDVRAEAPELVAIALARSGCTYSACGSERELGHDGLVVVDFTTPYAFSHAGPRMSSYTVHVSHADLGLGVDIVRAAIPASTPATCCRWSGATSWRCRPPWTPPRSVPRSRRTWAARPST